MCANQIVNINITTVGLFVRINSHARRNLLPSLLTPITQSRIKAFWSRLVLCIGDILDLKSFIRIFKLIYTQVIIMVFVCNWILAHTKFNLPLG